MKPHCRIRALSAALFALIAMPALSGAVYGQSAADAAASTSAPGVVGDGVHDDTAGLQTLLDSRKTEIRFPSPSVCLLIGKPLKIHSNQTLILDRHAVIRLKAGANQVMITNDDHDQGNENITLIGGVWDMDNVHQSLTAYQEAVLKHVETPREPYDPASYLGVLMRFNRVTNLTIRSLTLKDPVTYGMQLGNLRQFTVEDITFDYNLRLNNMDGVHLNGNCRFGRIANLKGATNDDMVALNADDGGSGEMCRGPIEDVAVDGLFCEHGYTAIRLLSAGSPVRRIHISNIFGSYRFNVVSFTNHQVHPGSPSVFDDISIRGVFCSKSSDRMSIDPRKPGSGYLAMFWIDAPAVVSSLSVSDLHRTETTWAAETIAIERGATVESLQMSDISLINRTEAPIDLLTNRGAIGALSMTNVYAKAENTASQGAAVRNSGTIRESTLQAVHAVNVSPEIVK